METGAAAPSGDRWKQNPADRTLGTRAERIRTAVPVKVENPLTGGRIPEELFRRGRIFKPELECGAEDSIFLRAGKGAERGINPVHRFGILFRTGRRPEGGKDHICRQFASPRGSDDSGTRFQPSGVEGRMEVPERIVQDQFADQVPAERLRFGLLQLPEPAGEGIEAVTVQQQDDSGNSALRGVERTHPPPIPDDGRSGILPQIPPSVPELFRFFSGFLRFVSGGAGRQQSGFSPEERFQFVFDQDGGIFVSDSLQQFTEREPVLTDTGCVEQSDQKRLFHSGLDDVMKNILRPEMHSFESGQNEEIMKFLGIAATEHRSAESFPGRGKDAFCRGGGER